MRDRIGSEQCGQAHQQQSLLARREIARLRHVFVLLRQPAQPLHNARVNRARVEIEVAPTHARLVAPAQPLRAGQVDEEPGAFARRRDEGKRRRPVLELLRRPFHLIRREIAGVEAHQHQRVEVDLLERDSGLRERAGAERFLRRQF
jgi:hypothetical protein